MASAFMTEFAATPGESTAPDGKWALTHVPVGRTADGITHSVDEVVGEIYTDITDIFRFDVNGDDPPGTDPQGPQVLMVNSLPDFNVLAVNRWAEVAPAGSRVLLSFTSFGENILPRFSVSDAVKNTFEGVSYPYAVGAHADRFLDDFQTVGNVKPLGQIGSLYDSVMLFALAAKAMRRPRRPARRSRRA